MGGNFFNGQGAGANACGGNQAGQNTGGFGPGFGAGWASFQGPPAPKGHTNVLVYQFQMKDTAVKAIMNENLRRTGCTQWDWGQQNNWLAIGDGRNHAGSSGDDYWRGGDWYRGRGERRRDSRSANRGRERRGDSRDRGRSNARGGNQRQDSRRRSTTRDRRPG